MPQSINKLLFFLISFIFIASSSLIAQEEEGYFNKPYQKRQNEIGGMMSYSYLNVPSSFPSEDFGYMIQMTLGFVHQYNFNDYFGWHSEFDMTWEPLFLSDTIIKASGISSNVLNQMSFKILTGMRYYPFKRWFFLGGGVGLRFFQNMMNREDYAKLEPHVPSLYGDNSPWNNTTRFSIAPQYYFELGVNFPTEYIIIEAGYRWRANLLGIIQQPLNVKTDYASQLGWGEIMVAITAPIGKKMAGDFKKSPSSHYPSQRSNNNNYPPQKGDQRNSPPVYNPQEEAYLWEEARSSNPNLNINLSLDNLSFNSSENKENLNLTDDSRLRLNDFIPIIYKLNPSRIIVKGYYVSSSEKSKNPEIAYERALAVKNYLESYGIKSYQISIEVQEGYDPITSSHKRMAAIEIAK